jgi:hypothetical protein
MDALRQSLKRAQKGNPEKSAVETRTRPASRHRKVARAGRRKTA